MTTGSIRQDNCEHDWELKRTDTFENIAVKLVTIHRMCRKCGEYQIIDKGTQS